MSDIVGDAKAWLESYDNSALPTHSENCHRWHVGCLIERLVAEVERHRMTAEEREILALVKETADAYSDSHVSIAVQAYLDRTAPKEGGNG